MRHFTVTRIFVITLSLFLPLSVFAMKNEPNGFGGIKWGDDIKSVKDIEYLYTRDKEREIHIYRKKKELTQIGGAKISSVEYEFHRGKFIAVTVKVEDLSNFIKLKNYCFEVFGEGNEITPGLERYLWEGRKTVVKLISNFEIS